MDDITSFRSQKDHYFKNTDDSPLTVDQKKNFTGLKYFPYSEKYIFHNLELQPHEDQRPITIQTSKGDADQYTRAGKLIFTVDNTICHLTVFRGADGSLFLPFKDETSGSKSYPAGRYLEIQQTDGKISLDFNYAYNPYCSYNDNWRCPLCPAENILPIPIEAGEKKFHD
ncbi:MAG TPA: DUF1684 domain-containing protein [Patescibacteria group bacterium]